MRIADVIIDELSKCGIDHCFTVTGGASMHLNDAVGINNAIEKIYMHHEQACAMAAEGFARTSLNPALVIATAGPGAINTLNGIFGAFTDSIPMLVLFGQSRTDTLKRYWGLEDLRQLGDQEAPAIQMVKQISKFSGVLDVSPSEKQIRDLVQRLYNIAVSGRPGPVVLEIPVNIQASTPSENDYKDFHLPQIAPEVHLYDEDLEQVVELLTTCKKPVILTGTGVLLANAQDIVKKLSLDKNIPILTAWTHDTFEDEFPTLIGRPGTIGTRPGNIVQQNSDLILVLGSRLNIRQIGYNHESFAVGAKRIQVDIDKSELEKPFPSIDLKIHCDILIFLRSLISHPRYQQVPSFNKWLNWSKEIKKEYEIQPDNYHSNKKINPYKIISKIIEVAPNESVIVCGDATACIVPFQVSKIKPKMRLFSNSGSASMGYDLPAAIGAAISSPKKTIICFAGDGSIMMNLQEFQTAANLNLNIKFFILCNEGYLSIRQTQSNFFGHLNGADTNSGLSFPNFAKLGEAFGINSYEINSLDDFPFIEKSFRSFGPEIITLSLDENQEFIPRLKSKFINGTIKTPTLDDMYPHLSPEELESIRNSANQI
jgi:acetolactate synthase-1/2/3 large subunit